MAEALREAKLADHPAILRLNQASEHHTSPLNETSLAQLIATSHRTLMTDDGSAVLIAMNERSAYASHHFLWLRAKVPRFIYVDRVIVGVEARRRGLATELYAAVFAIAQATMRPCVVCEINHQPRNPVSDAFHAALDFTEIGRAQSAGNAKTVRYLKRDVSSSW